MTESSVLRYSDHFNFLNHAEEFAVLDMNMTSILHGGAVLWDYRMHTEEL